MAQRNQKVPKNEDAELMANILASFAPNPEGMTNHIQMWDEMTRRAAKGQTAPPLSQNGREFLHEACSAEFVKATSCGTQTHPPNRDVYVCQKEMWDAIIGRAAEGESTTLHQAYSCDVGKIEAGVACKDSTSQISLPKGDVYVGSVQLFLKLSDYLRILVNKSTLFRYPTLQHCWPVIFRNFKFLLGWLQDAADNAVLRPCHCKGKHRDRRTFHQKADGLYVLSYENDHMAFGLIEPRKFIMLDYYLAEKRQWEEYKSMVAWGRSLYLKRISKVSLPLLEFS